ncbi:MAG: NlpC/P60 family protein [Longimonas sp.]|uniref:C40 family peptidase n=1 Tax=Longimonas sp. TaxID=2039626 RepID=UPI003974C008
MARLYHRADMLLPRPNHAMIDQETLWHHYHIGPAAVFSAALLVGTLVLFVGGCGSSASTTQSDATTQQHTASEDLVARWETEAARWEGVPHQWGGTTRRGIDCSALVQTLYRDVANVRLPRTTRAQVRTGARVRQQDLQPGDLVFFHLDKSRHVGVYLEDGQFVHASSSQGVAISDLSESYWAERYWTARRISAAQPGQANSGAPTNASGSASSRSGW